ncbi:MAG TPA: HAMP domain-containing sensor histidine kinase [Rhizomicrobium sp.]|nr:HAMP domain-containing sensor histidine kinase [Rhizomicrobium sp.]
MRAPSIVRTIAFRIVLVYVVLFILSTVAIVAFAYWNTARALNAETDQTIDAEISGLGELYERGGLNVLTDSIIVRSRSGGQSLYLLTDSEHHPIAGNLDAWPDTQPASNGFVEFDFQRGSGSDTRNYRARGRIFRLTGDFQLLVARDVHERYETERSFTTALPWSIGLMLLLGVLGGGLISRNLVARLDSINRTSREIVAGNLSRRIPITRAGDELDALAQDLNHMLDRNERLMRGMRDVTDSIAHDLRTPLNRLRNRLESLQLQIDPESQMSQEVDAAVGDTDRLIQTFNALLLIAEAEAGAVREAMARVDLPHVIEGVAELYEPLAEEKGLALEIAPGRSASIRGNVRLISQALANLVDNAIKYTPEGGRIRIAAEDRPQGVALSVADTGPGIPSTERGHVLERFVRLEESRNSPGTGLGLSLVAAVARMHEARLELGDNNPGLKATLIFPFEMPIGARKPA